MEGGRGWRVVRGPCSLVKCVLHCTVLQKIGTAPARVAMVMQRLSQLEPSELIPLEPCLVSHLCDFLEGETPRGLQESVAQLWQRLNTVMSKK